jgi:hypothetical protein
VPAASETLSFVFNIRSSFRWLAALNLPRRSHPKPWLAALVAVVLAGCGGGSEAPTQTVRGERYSFAAPGDWRVERTSHSVSVTPRAGEVELLSVSVFRIARPLGEASWPQVVRELDRVARDYARRLPGRLTSRATARVSGRRARRYDFAYRRGGTDVGQRLVFLFRGRREFQLLCRYPAPPSEAVAAACDRLAASFRLR